MTANQSAVPPRPRAWEEPLSFRLFTGLSPRLPAVDPPPAPEALAPFEELSFEHPHRPGRIAGTFYPAAGKPRGAVLLLHPWLPWGRAYFHRRGRIEALRKAGYQVFTPDLPGFGDSTAPKGFYDRDLETALDGLLARSPGRPLHIWGVSSGGYWMHPVLGRRPEIAGAMFEDVSTHLLEWAWRSAPLYRPFYLTMRTIFPRTYRFLDARRHAAAFRVRKAAYVSGELDPGVRPVDTLSLAEACGARHLIVPRARHLAAIKLAGDEVIRLALETFAEAEKARAAPRPSVPLVDERLGRNQSRPRG